MEKINDMAEYLFHQGTNYRAYEYLGVHKTDGGYVFRVWAPNADKIFLAGDFNDWGEDAPLERISEGGVWEITLGNDQINAGNKYKYKIYGCGQVHFKADPYAIEAGLPPETASVVPEFSEYKWRDGGWLAYRKRNTGKFYSLPMNIYELHMGSWRSYKHE